MRALSFGGIIAVILLTVFAITGKAQPPPIRILPSTFNEDRENQMMRSFQRRQVHRVMDRRLEEFEKALESPEALQSYQARRRSFLSRTFGAVRNREPLNPEITGMIRRDGFRIEKVLLESEPGFHITANLYLPEGAGPFPGILVPCGHAATGKAYDAYQKVSILLAKHGFVALCFDPIGQGERRQLIGANPHPILRPRSEHPSLGVAPILLGKCLGALMVNDGIRAIDYLSSRTEVDPTRIGCTGNSGGGNLTSYLMAHDDRIVAAAPGCFITTHRRKNESPGPGDAEQNLFRQLREQFDHPDFIIARAPRPTLILSATHDFVPIEGTWEAFRQSKRAYTVLGYPDRVDLIEDNGKHGFNRRLREGCVTFFKRWLTHEPGEVFEEINVPVLTEPELQVTPHGQALWLPGARSLFDLNVSAAQELAAEHTEITPAMVREITGIRPLEELPVPGVAGEEKASPQRLVLKPEAGISLPTLFWPGGTEIPVLFVPGDGKNDVLDEAGQWHRRGHPVMIVEIRDTGETRTRNWRFFGADFYIGQMLGQSWLAMRTEDVLLSARWLSSSSGSPEIRMIAIGEAGPAAEHAAFLEPGLFSDVIVRDSMNSWTQLMDDRDALKHLHQAVYGALRFYDLPDLRTNK